MRKCNSCGTQIQLIETEPGKHMMVETKRITIVLTNGKLVWGYLPHWDRCTNTRRKDANIDK